ncbi:MAG: polysaccharide biosynthesis C-terminal domain-containing protein, partial [Candidatus Eremiobacteraeota bacterium]|nr:polysaccharide biosynthesis C-terminal domain-containing protein [Candidatus Eremiobacteraeota bacterium]
VFIPRYAAVGAALSSLVGSCVGVVLSAAWGMRMVHMPIPMRSWLKTGLAAAGMAIAIRLVPERAGTLNLLAIATLGSIVYAALAIGLRPDVMRAYLRPCFGARIAWLHRS